MRQLSFDLRFELAGKHVRLVHGSPRKVNEPLQPVTTRNYRLRAGISSPREPAVAGYDRLPPGRACVARV
jgi:hypothetical protein